MTMFSASSEPAKVPNCMLRPGRIKSTYFMTCYDFHINRCYCDIMKKSLYFHLYIELRWILRPSVFPSAPMQRAH
jgi:hypothetical protein